MIRILQYDIFFKEFCMKTYKMFVFLSILMFVSGCSKTWSGVKQDSKNAWNATKQTVHKATE